jgi:transketolase
VRATFIRTLVEVAAEDERIVLLTGDLGFTVIEPFAERFPARFLNVGVAEQNMVGVATGLAEAGFVPFVYSIATFATLRPYEFIRNGPVLHGLPVRIVGVGGGLDYGLNGVTHYALEDVALMRAQPGLKIIAPADADQAEAALLATAVTDDPIYFRIAREGSPLPGLDGRFELGRASILGHGTDVAFVALGTCARPALEAADRLAAEGIKASVAVVASVEPTPIDDLVDLLSRASLAVSVEDHYVAGGLGSIVAEVITEHDLDCRLVRCGVRNMPRGVVGSQAYLYELHGLSATALAERVLASISIDVRN